MSDGVRSTQSVSMTLQQSPLLSAASLHATEAGRYAQKQPDLLPDRPTQRHSGMLRTLLGKIFNLCRSLDFHPPSSPILVRPPTLPIRWFSTSQPADRGCSRPRFCYCSYHWPIRGAAYRRKAGGRGNGVQRAVVEATTRRRFQNRVFGY